LELVKRILRLSFDEKYELFNHWRFCTEDRRTQIFSLLAANAFRPRMGHEERTGDDEDLQGLLLEKNRENKNNPGLPGLSFFTGQGAIWFLRLCIRFYLPLVLAVKTAEKPDNDEQKSKQPGNDDKKSKRGTDITTVGWGLTSGPRHAVQCFVKSGQCFAAGMMRLDHNELLKKFNNNQNKNNNQKTWTWCFYGVEDNKAWAVVSLWRVLGLIGRLLEIDRDYDGFDDVDKIELIKEQLEIHLKGALVVENLPGKGINELNIDKWKLNEQDKTKMRQYLSFLSAKLFGWLKVFHEGRIEPLKTGTVRGDRKNKKRNKNSLDKKREAWEQCFVRRVHGDNIVSFFILKLEEVHFEKSFSNFIAKDLIEKWGSRIDKYWDNCSGDIKNLFMKCPILSIFLGNGKVRGLEEGALRKLRGEIEKLKKLKTEKSENKIAEGEIIIKILESDLKEDKIKLLEEEIKELKKKNDKESDGKINEKKQLKQKFEGEANNLKKELSNSGIGDLIEGENWVKAVEKLKEFGSMKVCK
jgi:hypothetical protein